MRKLRFRFVGTSGDGKILHWESVQKVFGDSRHVEISCSRAWFWGDRTTERRRHR